MKRKMIGLFAMGVTLLAAPAFGEGVSVEKIRASVGSECVSAERFLEIEEERERESEYENEEIVAKACNYLYYDYSLQYLDSVSYEGSLITLVDGSSWVTKPSDGRKIQHWSDYYSDGAPAEVYLTSNNNWIFGKDYKYRIVNRMTGESALVNIADGPYKKLCFYIWNIDYYSGIVELMDFQGVYIAFNMSGWDKGVLEGWQCDDYVIVGRNTRWNASSNPYLLINVHKLTNVRASAGL
jgi:hypothetical protein